MITSGKGKYKVWLEKVDIGSDKLLILKGGKKPHIGGVAICRPNEKPKIISFDNHKDHKVLLPIAEKGCNKFGVTTVATGGIHIDNATKNEIDIILKNCEELISCI